VSTPLGEIAARISGEVSDLDAAVRKALRSWAAVGKGTAEQDVYLDSVALNLHSFYSGLERLFELIARTIDQKMPDGESWHRELLLQMTRDMPDMRPAVISEGSADRLEEFRRFRHLVRNVYASDLIPAKMASLLAELPGMWGRPVR